jgi:hypothetical protein
MPSGFYLYQNGGQEFMKSILSSLIILFLVNCLNSQVIKATVNINFNHLPTEEYRILKELQNAIEDYYNGYAWTDDEYEFDIDLNIYIIIETVRKKSEEKIYKAQFQIKSTSGESFYDKEWEFPYQIGYALEHNKVQFDPISHFLDYYAYLVLAGELDTYGISLGTSYYDAAADLANRALSSKYTRGWSNRINELQKITHIHLRPLRDSKPDFFEAEYAFQEGKIDEAKTHALKVLDAIEKVVKVRPNSRYLSNFFDAHYNSFAQIFNKDNKNLERLMYYDINLQHRETYENAME